MFWKKKPLLDEDDQRRIVGCIQAAEIKTSGEVRIFIENHCSYMDAMDRAIEVFANLGMHQTVERNAIIIYIALKDRQFALFGDTAIYEKAGGPAFWETAAQMLKEHLSDNRITEGICNCINELGRVLSQHFPHDATINKNELPDEIVFGK